MRCANCQAEIALTARYCPSCGEVIVREQDVKSATEVSPEWLKSILESQSYQVEVAPQDANSLIARHDSRPNLILTLRRNVSLVTIQSWFNLKKPSWGQKGNCLAALNKANSIQWLCTCFAPDSQDTLMVSTFIYLTERLSSRDVAAFLEMFSEGVIATIENSGIRRFA